MRHTAYVALISLAALLLAGNAVASAPRYESGNNMQVEAETINGVGSLHFLVTVASCKPRGAPQFRASAPLYYLWRCHLVTDKGGLDYNVTLTKDDTRCHSHLRYCSWWAKIVAPWQPPAGFTVWQGFGTGKSVVAYQPSTCPLPAGGTIANGASDPSGNLCWSYLMVTKNGCQQDIYAEVQVIENGVVVDYSNDLKPVAAGQQVQMQGIVRGHGNASLVLSEISCAN